MVTRSDVVAEAKTWKETPYKDKGRRRGLRIDCLGLIIGVAHELGITDYEFTRYTRRPQGLSLKHGLEENLVRRTGRVKDVVPGQIALFVGRVMPQHLGIISEDSGLLTVIHADSNIGKCVESPLFPEWSSRFMAAYDYPGVEE